MLTTNSTSVPDLLDLRLLAQVVNVPVRLGGGFYMMGEPGA
jgi:hypothetical protein